MGEFTPQGITGEISNYTNKTGMFKVQTADDAIREAMLLDSPVKLLGSLIHSQEFCIFYGDTNLGKTVVATQIGLSVAGRKEFPGLAYEGNPITVLLIDFELSAKQVQIRYTDEYGNPFVFGQHFIRAEIDLDADLPDDTGAFENYIISCIRDIIMQTGAQLVIVDNITWLSSNVEKAKDAAPLMKQLKKLQRELAITLLVIAHTPKRDRTRPITQNDLSGSKMLMNFADSAFAIGASERDKNLRYLKQIKVRNCGMEYDSENVLVYSMGKQGAFVGFVAFVGFGCEREHLKEYSENERTETKERAIELRKEGKSIGYIAKELGHSKSTIQKYCKDVRSFDTENEHPERGEQ